MTDGEDRDGTGAEELLAKALRAHAARASVPPRTEESGARESGARESADESAPTTRTTPVAERTRRIEPPDTNRPDVAPDRMLAPHDVNSRVEIQAELGAVSAAQPRVAGEPAPRPRLPVRWILLLAVLLGLAAGSIAGLLTVL